MRFNGLVSNQLVQVEPATAFSPVVVHWLIFPTSIAYAEQHAQRQWVPFLKSFVWLDLSGNRTRAFRVRGGCSTTRSNTRGFQNIIFLKTTASRGHYVFSFRMFVKSNFSIDIAYLGYKQWEKIGLHFFYWVKSSKFKMAANIQNRPISGSMILKKAILWIFGV